MPAMPIFFLIGILAVVEFSSAKTFRRYQWLVTTSWNMSLIMGTLLFVVLGARAFARDVAFIEQEMVATAHWVSANLPPDAVLAVHDIGALGYFDDHVLIDLAGLITPDVIPFIRDEDRLTIYLNESGADYLVAFSDLYPAMIVGREVEFETNGALASEMGDVRLTVYRWK